MKNMIIKSFILLLCVPSIFAMEIKSAVLHEKESKSEEVEVHGALIVAVVSDDLAQRLLEQTKEEKLAREEKPGVWARTKQKASACWSALKRQLSRCTTRCCRSLQSRHLAPVPLATVLATGATGVGIWQGVELGKMFIEPEDPVWQREMTFTLSSYGGIAVGQVILLIIADSSLSSLRYFWGMLKRILGNQCNGQNIYCYLVRIGIPAIMLLATLGRAGFAIDTVRIVAAGFFSGGIIWEMIILTACGAMTLVERINEFINNADEAMPDEEPAAIAPPVLVPAQGATPYVPGSIQIQDQPQT